MIRRRCWFALCAVLAAGSAHAADPSSDPLAEIVVTATLRGGSVAEAPQSITVLDAATLRGAGVQHLEDVLSLVPDLNWASGTARPRYFQLRGIGEVEQYQGAPNPSVGFLIDDIDFSGVGMPATLFDTRQVEVLRGPQGTAYGANAIAGLISIHTEDPAKDLDVRSEISAATYDTRSAGIAVGDGFADGNAAWRVVAQRYVSDGFRHDIYLGERSTNGFDETMLRAKLHWQLGAAIAADLTFMHADIDDGYDAWSLYNTYDTYSNQPGRDAQLSNGAALKLRAELGSVAKLRSVTSSADSKILYSFDGDWGNDVLWGPYAPYDYFQSDHRRRRTLAEDLRWVGDPSAELFGRFSWVAGAYLLHLTESDDLSYQYDDQYDGAGDSELRSNFASTNIALYGSLTTVLSARSTLSTGLRIERRHARYTDSADEATPFPAEADRMIGGNISLETRLDDTRHAYVTLARGYKGGGFNIGSGILSEQREFGPESLWSVETGLKVAGGDSAFQLQTDVFYMRRQHMQVYLSQQLQQGNPLDYVFYTQNASSGENYGLEGEAAYPLAGGWRVSATGSLLRTRYLGVSGIFGALDLDGRAQPFAPSYKVSAAVEYRRPAGWFARLDTSAIGSFYYYTSDAQASRAYSLTNLRIGYERGPWSGSLWAHNLFNARYAQNGFYFGLIPPNYPQQNFVDRGDPRQLGITVAYALAR